MCMWASRREWGWREGKMGISLRMQGPKKKKTTTRVWIPKTSTGGVSDDSRQLAWPQGPLCTVVRPDS